MLWFKLADKLKMSVAEVMHRTTATEFPKWVRYMEHEWDEPTKEDYYLAQIAAEIRRGNVKSPGSVKTNDFLIKFTRAEEAKPLTEEQLKHKVQGSKNAWFGLMGVSRKPPKQPTPGATPLGNFGKRTRKAGDPISR